jgi:L,D-peptidoglycan transpeptidase YkuD (ErfK/YbiS/YcfS/YnhG family)
LLLVLSAGAWIVSRQLRQPPLNNLQRALDGLASARAAGADKNARDLYLRAENCLNSGREALRDANDGWWPFGAYERTDSLLKESIRLSELACTAAVESLSLRRKALFDRLYAVSDSLTEWGNTLADDLSRTDFKVMYRSASVRLDLASRLAQEGCVETADENLDSVQNVLALLSSGRTELDAAIAARSDKMREWVSQTLEFSRVHAKVALIADKAAHRLHVIRNGVVVESFNCDLGYNAGYQKLRAGDGATPEGMYRVAEIKRQSKFYRALLLNYPNESDRERFRRNLAAGVIPPGSKIGGLIEIHGHGARNEDWTDGCIALDNRDMDKLLKVTAKGTRVTIVRSWDGSR